MNPLTEPQKKMVEDHMGVAVILAKKAKRRNHRLDMDECVASAGYGLVQAAAKYDKSKSLFSTSGSIRARYQITDDLRDRTRWFNRGPKHVPQSPKAMPTNLAHRHDFSGIESDEAYERLTRVLGERQKKAVDLVYRHGMSNLEAAEAMGLGETRFYTIKQSAFNAIKANYKDQS